MPILDLQEAIDLIEEGKAEEAFPLLTTWAQQMPTYAAVHAVLARAYEAVARWEEAQAAWERTHFLMPNSPAVREGLDRVLRALNQALPAGGDRLIMDLDLETELEATLEALFNPFTLPQSSSEIIFEGELISAEEEAALAQAEAALATEADTEDIDEAEAFDETATALVDDEVTEEAVEEPEVVEEADAPPAEDEADVLEEDVEEQAVSDEEPGFSPEDEAAEEEILGQIIDEAFAEITAEIDAEEDVAEDIAEDPPQRDLDQILEEEEEAIRALEELAPVAGKDDGVVLEDWGEFEAEPDEDDGHEEGMDDLDRLIHELESARIIPQPDLEDLPPLDLEDDIEDMVSETLARIYASQNKYEEAAHIYEQLALQEPDEADRYNQLAAQMRALAGDAEE